MSHSGYSKLAYSPTSPTTSSSSEVSSIKLKEPLRNPHASTQNHGFWDSTSTLWPLAVYGLSALAISGFMACLNGRKFSLTERQPYVTLPNGTKVTSGRYALLQTDATTILSIVLSLFRWILATWIGALCWYILFYLLDMNGLSHRDVRCMITWGFLHPRTYFRNRLVGLMGGILVFTICAQFSAPLVTGSITWTPSNQAARLRTNPSVDVAISVDSSEWIYHNNMTGWRERVAVQAGGLVTVAWGRDIEKGVLKRAIRSAVSFEVNSTVANVTLPYFSITSFEWIVDPNTELTPYQLNIPDNVAPILSTRNGSTPFIVPGSVAFIPEGNWTLPNDFAPKPFPAPSIAEETRIMVAYLSFQPENPDCSDDSRMFGRPGPPPPVKFYRNQNTCYGFARVSYRAGAAMCKNCRISSSSTVQNDEALQVQADPMTYEALRLLPDVMGNLVLMNSSIPSQWDTFEEYVTSVLVRSYSGAWTALTERTSRWVDYGTLTTVVSPRLAASRADVDLKRIAVWLLIHLIVVTLGACFFVVQSRSTHPLTGDTSMVPFYLDTSQVTKPDTSKGPITNEELKVVSVDGQWKIVSERRVG